MVLHRRLPFCVPLSRELPIRTLTTSNPTLRKDGRDSNNHVLVLTTCSTLRLPNVTIDYERRNSIQATLFDSRGDDQHRPESNSDKKDHEDVDGLIQRIMDTWCSSRNGSINNNSTAANCSAGVAIQDENEIDLEDEEEDDDQDDKDGNPEVCRTPTKPFLERQEQQPVPRIVPHLLVLGTGCATPAPQRSSSGYALFLPNDRNEDLECRVVLECGDGAVSQLQRHTPTTATSFGSTLEQIRFIWVSHAHLDHYAGLPALLRAIDQQQQPISQSDEHRDKRHKPQHQSSSRRVLLVAPSKVIRYVRIHGPPSAFRWLECVNHTWMNGQHHAFLRDNVGISNVVHIPVEHCPHAFGVLMDVRDSPCVLCYSGDTRPCHRFAAICRDYMGHKRTRRLQGRTGPYPVRLLVHEATFLSNDEGMKEAKQKRHSTVDEAISIARQIPLDGCLLTHFSQRYTTARVLEAVSKAANETDGNSLAPIGCAVDGLFLPLTVEALRCTSDLTAIMHGLLAQDRDLSQKEHPNPPT